MFLTLLGQYLASFLFLSKDRNSEDKGKEDTMTKLMKISDLEQLKQFPFFTMSDVSDHCELSDCWIVLWDKVYDLTEFVREVSLISN